MDMKRVNLGYNRKIAAIVLSLLVVAADLFVSVSTVYGTLGGNATTIPSAIFLLFYIGAACAIFVVS